jgi:hypothetical protein
MELLHQTLHQPAILQSILAGQQPWCQSLLWFQRNTLATDWVAQLGVVAGFDSSTGPLFVSPLQSLDAGSHLMPATPRFFWLM